MKAWDLRVASPPMGLVPGDSMGGMDAVRHLAVRWEIAWGQEVIRVEDQAGLLSGWRRERRISILILPCALPAVGDS